MRAGFPPEQVPDALTALGWYDGPDADRVQGAILALSEGDLDQLLNYTTAAIDDYRDVLWWASKPKPTAEESAAAKARVDEMIREAARRRREYMEARFGVEGAERIQRSNQRLFGTPLPPEDSG